MSSINVACLLELQILPFYHPTNLSSLLVVSSAVSSRRTEVSLFLIIVTFLLPQHVSDASFALSFFQAMIVASLAAMIFIRKRRL